MRSSWHRYLEHDRCRFVDDHSQGRSSIWCSNRQESVHLLRSQDAERESSYTKNVNHLINTFMIMYLTDSKAT